MQPTQESLEEIRNVKLTKATTETISLQIAEFNVGVKLTELLNPSQFSNCRKLYRVTGFVLRFVNNLEARYKGGKLQLQTEENLTVKEIGTAERLWLLEIQRELTVDAKYFEKLEAQLNLFQDQHGLIRWRGRLSQLTLNRDTKYPILLPRDHYLTKLIVLGAHERVYHNKVKDILNELRSKFWIVRGRQLVKNSKVIHRCFLCKKLEGRPYLLPPPAVDLPSFRVTESPPFSKTGLDMAGPIYYETKERQMENCYIALFTCCVTRAVHLEVTTDLSTDSFLRAFRRFTAGRGTPNLIVSDNARYFKKANNILKTLFKQRDVRTYFQNQKIVWRFNLERAPWWGGLLERLVQSVKHCLKKVLGKSRLSLEEITTLIVEIENVLNCRPLTYIYTDEIQEALTPSHLIYGIRGGSNR